MKLSFDPSRTQHAHSQGFILASRKRDHAGALTVFMEEMCWGEREALGALYMFWDWCESARPWYACKLPVGCVPKRPRLLAIAVGLHPGRGEDLLLALRKAGYLKTKVAMDSGDTFYEVTDWPTISPDDIAPVDDPDDDEESEPARNEPERDTVRLDPPLGVTDLWVLSGALQSPSKRRDAIARGSGRWRDAEVGKNLNRNAP